MLKNVGIIIKSENDQAGIFSLYLVAHLTKMGISTWFEDESHYLDNTDLIIILGGDGTVLHSFRKYGQLQVPFLCVNFGTVGFLSTIDVNDFSKYLSKIVAGDYLIEERSVIQVSLIREEKETESYYALNDLVVRSNCLRITHQSLRIDGQILYEYEGDGIIAATATGSTGYSLSAGGAIIEPSLNNILIQSLCSRIRSPKTIIMGMNHTLEIICKDKEPISSCFIDGREYKQLFKNDVIRITRADINAKFVILDTNRYCKLLGKRFE